MADSIADMYIELAQVRYMVVNQMCTISHVNTVHKVCIRIVVVAQKKKL